MGKMNFLQGGYTGTLGETYGVKQRRTVFAKAKPFSHTPHNQTQKIALPHLVACRGLAHC